ncbi:thioredoxin-disulfide reductase [Anoxybacter fermentans]|uniref:Thioredoxin reductase n=1 Tax=Anoxybacter fermentans TaxID=1323375 RepID=A0A3S9SX59_9FIRM|nr:thioredoxin-disulfide reductase [Anoxybacter fermentans]AZR72881.1 thioredoxin-disulfide reductase [Anoxybacter fermentans]
MNKEYDLLIIGGGPAGLAAGIYGSRAKLKTAIIEKKRKPGGQAATTEEMENYPGFAQGTTGPELTKRMAEHAKAFGAEFIRTEALEIKCEGDKRIVKTRDGDLVTKTVIIATGAEPRVLGVKGEGEFRGRGVSYCATCDADFYTDLDVVVVGNGDAAVEEAIYLTRFARKVTIIVVHDEGIMDATKVIQERAYANPKIDFVWNSVLEEVVGDEVVTGVKIKNLKTGEITEMPCDGVFFFVGTVPKTDFVKDLIEMDDFGYIITNDKMETNVPGIFAAGDVRQKYLRQVVTAAADGAIAATAAEKYIAEEEGFKTDVLNADKPVLVIFWSPTVESTFDTINMLENLGLEEKNVKLVKIDTYKNRLIADRYEIKNIPTLLYFVDGELKNRLEDVTKENVLKIIEG